MKDQVQRAESIRKRMNERIPKGDYRKVARDMGSKISNTAIGNFLDGKVAVPRESTLDTYERWLEGQGVNIDNATAGGGVAEPESEFLAEVHAILRDQAIPPRDRVLLIDAAGSAWTRAVLFRAEANASGRNAVLQAAEDGGKDRTELLRESGLVSRPAPVQRAPEGDEGGEREAV